MKVNSKYETLSSKQYQINKPQSSEQYDLEERTLSFAKQVIDFVNKLPKTIANIEIGKQLIRSSGSVGANYIEAGESLGKKDFLARIKLSRKEAKESGYWLKLINCDKELCKIQEELVQEALELTKIFGSIVVKTRN